jgi:probable addiction module antidote protein
MNKLTKSYKADLLRDLGDPSEAAEYLNAALEDGNQDVFLLALRDVAEARGMTNLARDASLNRENMYKILSDKGNPKLSSLSAILNQLGLKMAIKTKKIHPDPSY